MSGTVFLVTRGGKNLVVMVVEVVMMMATAKFVGGMIMKVPTQYSQQ